MKFLLIRKSVNFFGNIKVFSLLKNLACYPLQSFSPRFFKRDKKGFPFLSGLEEKISFFSNEVLYFKIHMKKSNKTLQNQ